MHLCDWIEALKSRSRCVCKSRGAFGLHAKWHFVSEVENARFLLCSVNLLDKPFVSLFYPFCIADGGEGMDVRPPIMIGYLCLLPN
jgi:hypothetical protein